MMLLLLLMMRMCPGMGLTIGEGCVGVSELIKEGVGKRSQGRQTGHRAVVQQLGHLDHTS